MEEFDTTVTIPPPALSTTITSILATSPDEPILSATDASAWGDTTITVAPPAAPTSSTSQGASLALATYSTSATTIYTTTPTPTHVTSYITLSPPPAQNTDTTGSAAPILSSDVGAMNQPIKVAFIAAGVSVGALLLGIGLGVWLCMRRRSRRKRAVLEIEGSYGNGSGCEVATR